MKIIGMLGGAGSGKTTIGEYLVAKYGAKKYSFAFPLKEIIRRAFDLTYEQVFGSQAEKERVDPRYNVSGRWLMQKIGTQGVRAVLGPDFWWEHCLQQIVDDDPELAVIEDFRFQNEVHGFLSLNESNHSFPKVNIWRIESPQERATIADQNHQSEAEWVKCDFTNLVKPKKYGLEELYDEADYAAYESGLTPTVVVLK